MEQYVIKGGNPLVGERPSPKFRACGAFPDILPESWHSLLFASILTNAGGKSVGMPTKPKNCVSDPWTISEKCAMMSKKRRLLLCVF